MCARASLAGVLLALVAHAPVGAQGIRTERYPPFDVARACVVADTDQASMKVCERDVPAVVALAHADVGGLAWARGVAYNTCPECDCVCEHGLLSTARTGIHLIIPGGASAALEANLDVFDIARAEVCLVAGSAESCAQAIPGQQRITLTVSVAAPPDSSLVADPAVVVIAPERAPQTLPEGYARAGAATVLVRFFAYTIS